MELPSGNNSVTLFHVSSGGSSWSANGVSVTRHGAQMAVVGAHFDETKDMMLVEMEAEYDQLADWLGISGFKVKKDWKERPHISVEYNFPDEVILYQSEGWDWRIKWIVSYPTERLPQKSVEIEETPVLHIVASQPASYQTFNDQAQQFRKLLALWVGTSVKMTAATGIAMINGERHGVEFYWPARTDKHESDAINSFEIVASFREIRPNLPQMIHFYRENAEKVAPVLDLWDMLPFQEDIHYEQRFLNYCQIAEAFHRRTIGGTERTEEEYDNFRSVILEALPSEHREWLEPRLSFANEYSFRRRIRDLWERNNDTTQQFPQKEAQFSKRVTFIRNYLTHFKLRKNETPPEFAEVVTLEFYLRALIEVSMLRWLRLPDSVINERGRYRLARPLVVVDYKPSGASDAGQNIAT